MHSSMRRNYHDIRFLDWNRALCFLIKVIGNGLCSIIKALFFFFFFLNSSCLFKLNYNRRFECFPFLIG